jgi:uncharacterized membrane protein
MNNKFIRFFFILISIFLLVGCNNNSINNETKEHTIIDINKGENVVIDSHEVGKHATYYNYKNGETIIQLFSVKATNESVRVLFNTCNACNPSPNAYFIQDGDYFVCQNCKNRFHRDEIGLTKTYGCSPIAILDEDKKIDNDLIIISSNFIESYQSQFENINIYK